MFGLGTQEMFVLLVLGVIFFGKRLPEVGRAVGKTIMEFKSSLRGVEDEFRSSFRDVDVMSMTRPAPAKKFKRIEPTAPKFSEPADSI